MFKKIGQMSYRMAVMIMALMMALGVVSGNRNALARARTPVAAEITLMSDRLDGMAAKASNYITIANRLGVAVDPVTEERTKARGVASGKNGGNTGAGKIVAAADTLNQAIADLDHQIQAAIDTLPATDPNKSLEAQARAAAYDDWMKTRVSYIDIASYNSALEGLQSVYRAVPTRWIWSGYNYPQLSGQ